MTLYKLCGFMRPVRGSPEAHIWRTDPWGQPLQSVAHRARAQASFELDLDKTSTYTRYK